MSPADLIERPFNPVLRFAAQFGRDEIYAAVLGAVLTAAAYWLIGWLNGSQAPSALMASILPFVAPVCEKPGLVAHYGWEGVRDWKSGRGGLMACLRRSLFDGRAFRTVRADVLFHDPCYMAFMAIGVWVLAPETALAAALLSVLSFTSAVIAAAALEVSITEAMYRVRTRRLQRQGFTKDSYYETRYLISTAGGMTPDSALEKVAAAFDLRERAVVSYGDIYADHCPLPEYNGRVASSKFRSTTVSGPGTEKDRQSLQVVYTKSAEIGRDDPSLFRCFVVAKDKFHKPYVSGSTPDYGTEGDGMAIRFERSVARDPDGLFASVDCISGSGSFWLELKVRCDLGLLKKANEFVAMNFPVRGTTKNKRFVVETLPEFRQMARTAA